MNGELRGEKMTNDEQKLTQHDVVILTKILSRYQFMHPDEWPDGAQDAARLLLNILKKTH